MGCQLNYVASVLILHFDAELLSTVASLRVGLGILSYILTWDWQRSQRKQVA